MGEISPLPQPYGIDKESTVLEKEKIWPGREKGGNTFTKRRFLTLKIGNIRGRVGITIWKKGGGPKEGVQISH